MAQKKAANSRKLLPRVGVKVVLETLPPGLIDGLPEEDQKAISAIVGIQFDFRVMTTTADWNLNL